jgi:hypothetical protein
MMRSANLFLAVLAASLCMPVFSTPVWGEGKLDPTGSWKLLVKTPGRPTQESILKLEKGGDKFVGVMMNSQGLSTPLKDIELKGDALSFRFAFKRDGREFSFLYQGKLTADTYKGQGSLNIFGQKRTFDFEGKRMSAEAVTLAGLWKITVVLEAGQKLQPTLRLKQQGDNWSGGYLGTAGKEVPLQDVKLKDGELSFRIVDKIEEDKVPFHYVGKLKDNTLSGTVTLGAGKQTASLKFQAQKVETPTAKIDGIWKLKVHYKDGVTFEPTLKITQTGSAFSGSYTGEQGDTPIAEALIFGDEFTFEVVRERDKKGYRLKYQGKVIGDTLKGTVDYEFDGIVGNLEFEGKRVAAADANAAKKSQ